MQHTPSKLKQGDDDRGGLLGRDHIELVTHVVAVYIVGGIHISSVGDEVADHAVVTLGRGSMKSGCTRLFVRVGHGVVLSWCNNAAH